MPGGLSLRRSAVNRFGREAMENWRTLAPAAFAQIPNPSKHFSELGVVAQSQWADLWPQLVTPDVPGEDFFHKAGRIEAAKMSATEIIRAEMLLPPAEVLEPEEGENDPDPLAEVYQAMREYLDEE
jgi:hypothetical protein